MSPHSIDFYEKKSKIISYLSSNTHFICSSTTTYRKVPKFSDARKLCCKLPKVQEKRPKLWVFRQKDANSIANSEDPDQTAPLSGSALFAQTCLSEDLGSLRYAFMEKSAELSYTY